MIKKIYLLILLFIAISCKQTKILTSDDLLYQSTSENLDRFGSFLWSKNKNDSIAFNDKNLKIIKSKKGQYYKSLVKYTTYLVRQKYKVENIIFPEKAKILAYLIHYGERIPIEKKYSFIKNTIYDDDDLEYYNEFEKHNYYNLSGLKKEYQELFEEFKPRKKKEVIPPRVQIKASD